MPCAWWYTVADLCPLVDQRQGYDGDASLPGSFHGDFQILGTLIAQRTAGMLWVLRQKPNLWLTLHNMLCKMVHGCRQIGYSDPGWALDQMYGCHQISYLCTKKAR